MDPADTPQMVEQVRQTLRDLSAPFPDEEVGVGARWRKVSEIDAPRVPAPRQEETLTLVEMRGGHGVVDDDFTQTAQEQPHASAAADAGAPSVVATGRSRIRFDLDRLVPQTTFEGRTEMGAPATANDDAGRLTMILRVGISIQGTVRY